MSSSGCFGKLRHAVASTLVADGSSPGSQWLDAVASPNGTLVSIDTVRFEASRHETLRLAVLHSINDIFAAGGLPDTICVSLHLADEPELSSLLALQRYLSAEAHSMKLTLGKQHTAFGNAFDAVTIASIGTIVQHLGALPTTGIVALCGSLDFAQPSVGPPIDCLAEIAERRHVASTPGIRMKDVSGDGLAGALLQLSVRENVSIQISRTALYSFCDKAELDNCSLDANYADFSGMIDGYHQSDCSVMRRIMFLPAFFGPLVCLAPSEFLHALPTAQKIGDFNLGRPQLALVE